MGCNDIEIGKSEFVAKTQFLCPMKAFKTVTFFPYPTSSDSFKFAILFFLGEFDLMSRGIIVASSRTLAEQISGFIKIYSTPRDQDTPCFPF